MQSLRSALRSCQKSSRRPVTGFSQCTSTPQPAISVQWCQHRTQHNSFGPHKEYFQVPGREPKPDLTPYVRGSQQQPQLNNQSQPQSSISSSQGHAVSAPESQSPTRGWQSTPRFVRSAIWFFLFLQLGAVVGTAVVTWEYLSPPFEPGSPEEQELVEEILEALDTHPMVEDLRENEWVEVDAFTPDLQHGLKGRHMLHQVLGGNNTQGVFMKVFHHPSQEFTMLVFFLGFGVEGWPDVIHGGTIATLLQEGLSKHLAYYYPAYFTTPENRSKIDFKKPCKPGEIYGVLVAPSGRKSVTAGNVHLTELQMTSLLVQLAGAPVVSSNFDISSNTETHTVGIPARRGVQPTHAVCQAEVKIVPKQLNGDGKAFEVGAKDDEGFARALDFLKNRPEFKNSTPPPSSQEERDDD